MTHTRISVDGFNRNGDNYPFVTNVTYLKLLIEDLHISTVRPNVPALWLRWYSADVGLPADAWVPSPVNQVDLLIEDDDHTAIFDTRLFTFNSRLWSGNRYLLTWTDDDTIIMATVQKDTALQRGYVATQALLDPRVTDWRPRPITDVKVRDGNQLVSAVRSDGSVQFREGYNADFGTGTAVSDRGERLSAVSLNFLAGAGLGRHAGCDLNRGVTKIGGAAPDAQGNLLINGDSCVTLKPRLLFSPDGAVVQPGTFTLHDGCSAPCECDDFTDLYKYVRRTWSRYQSIAGRASKIRDLYHGIRDYMATAQECSERQTLRVFVWPIRPCTFAAAVGVCNPSDEPIHDVTLEFSISDGEVDIGANAVCDSIYRVDYFNAQQMPTPYYFEQPLPNARIVLRCIPPGSMGYVVFRGVVPSLPDTQPVKLCVFCPVGMPLPLQTPDEYCGEAALSCEAAENCDGAPTSA